MNFRALLFKSGVGFDLRGQTIRSVQITRGFTCKLSIQCHEISMDDEESLESMSALSGVVAVPTAETLVQRFELPFQSKRTFKDIVTLELERRLPTDIVKWYHSQLPPAISGNAAVQLTAAVPKRRLTTILAPLHDKGFYPATGLHAGAIITLLEHCALNEYGLFLEVGEEEATLIIKSSQRIEMVRGFRYGMSNAALLIQELRRSIAAFTPVMSDHHNTTLTVIGSAIESSDFISALSEGAGLEVKRLPLRLKGHDEELPPSFAVSAGAALQACKGKRDFLFPVSAPKKRVQFQTKRLRTPALALLAVIACWAISSGLEIQRQHRVLGQITKLQTQVFRRAFPDAPKHLRPSQYIVVLRERIKRLASSPQAKKTDSLAAVDILRLVHLATQNSKVLVRKIMMNNSKVTLTLQAETPEQLQSVTNKLAKFQWVQDIVQRQDKSLSTKGAIVATTQFHVRFIAKGQH